MKKLILAAGLVMALSGCDTAYYNTMESLGVHKREILVDRVVEARDSQKDAQKQFTSALEQFKSVVNVENSKLESAYNKLNSEFEDSEDAANEIRERIAAIETVADALFKEWTAELSQYTNASLKRDSQKKLNSTKQKYQQLLQAMNKAEGRLTPVLNAMRDQVLYLKHNLNARAIQSLKGEVVTINRNVDSLIAAMGQAIAEADAFVKAMEEG